MVAKKGIDLQWAVYPILLYIVNLGAVKIDWDHHEMRWIDPAEIDYDDTVPGLKVAF